MAQEQDDFDLERFVTAQARSYSSVVRELRAGNKTGHWMWYVFPQIQGLGTSPTSRFYAIASIDEARAYLAHAVLGQRLRDCTQLVLEVEGRSAEQIFHYPDHLKFHSSMTLFERAADAPAIFRAALDRFFGGEPDARTLEILGLPR